MAGNRFGHAFQLSTFGESHGPAIGGVLDGCPPGLELDIQAIQQQLQRRRPGQSAFSTPRNEPDEVHFLSGIFEGKTLGTPIAYVIWNRDSKSADYASLQQVYRPSHADFTYEARYGRRDYRGGGRSSARETLARVVAGSIAEQVLAHYGIRIRAWVKQIHTLEMPETASFYERDRIDQSMLRCPHEATSKAMEQFLEKLMLEGDSAGGVIRCVVEGVPAGWGAPVFDKLHADLGKAMLSINAVKGFSVGSGFRSAQMLGSEHNDAFEMRDGKVGTQTNYSGGIQGGISNGEPLVMDIAFKPVASIKKSQQSIDQAGNPVELTIHGRHDPCVVPRAVPIVEAMAALVLADHALRIPIQL